MTKVEEFRKQHAMHTESMQEKSNNIKWTEVTKEVKACKTPKIRVANLDNGLCEIIKE